MFTTLHRDACHPSAASLHSRVCDPGVREACAATFMTQYHFGGVLPAGMQVRAEAKRVGKALDSGTAQGGVGRQPAPLTEHNTMSPSVTAYDLVRRSDELALEMEQLGAAQGLLLRAEEVLAKVSRVLSVFESFGWQQRVGRSWNRLGEQSWTCQAAC